MKQFKSLYYLDARKQSLLFKLIIYVAAILTFSSLCLIIGYILLKGIGHIQIGLFAWNYTSDNVSMMPAIWNTVLIMILTLLIALPIGIGSSIYLIEYSNKNHPIVSIVRVATETLPGIPSIIYGLFGMLFFVKTLNLGMSVFSGSATLSIVVLPLIMRTTEEALLSVPNTYREGSYALGASKLRTIFKIILPAAIPGIFSGVVLAIGRIMGESAALIFTAGTVAKTAGGLFDSGRSLAVHMYVISGEGMYLNQAYATAVVLLIIVFVINTVSEFIAHRLGGK